MPESRIAVGFRIGLVSGAMTSGALVGLGLRRGEALAPFQLYGRVLTASLTGLIPTPAAATVVGIAGHFFWMLLLGTAFALVVRAQHLRVLTALALLFCFIAGWLAMRVFPPLLGAAAVASLGTGQLLFFLALLALALVVGTRIATW